MKSQCDNKIEYRAPISGYYQIEAKMAVMKPTGRFKLVDNEDKSWWQFWKDDLVLQEIYEVTEEWEGKEVKFLEKDQLVQIIKMERIGN